MKRLLLALVLVVAAAAIFLGPPLRAAFASTNVDIVIGRGDRYSQLARNAAWARAGKAVAQIVCGCCAIGERVEITADLLAPSFWLIDDQVFFSMNLSLGLIVRL